jgi:VanZ family protein
MRIRLPAALGAVLWMGVIWGLSSLPGTAVPGRFGTLGHVVLYSVLGVLLALALDPQRVSPRLAVLAVVLASLWGVSDEYHQSFVPGRFPDPVDWAVDTLSATVAVIAMWRLNRTQ